MRSGRGPGSGVRGPERRNACLLLAVVGVLLVALPATATADGTRELLAAPVAGWTSAGPVRLFRGAELYGHIDGGAEIYLELGFVEAAVASWQRGKELLDVELYRMADAPAALGIYVGRCGAETPASGLTARHTVGRHQLQLVHGPFYAIVETAESSTVPASALVEIAMSVVTRLPAATACTVLDALPAEHRVAGSERVIRGPLGLAALITLGDGDILSQAGTVTAVQADYRASVGAPTMTLLLVRYPEAAAASRALEHIRKHLDSAITVTASAADRLDFLDYSRRAGTITLVGDRLEMRLLPAPKS
jgi:hypothetical protein